jgi:hypothetical protein
MRNSLRKNLRQYQGWLRLRILGSAIDLCVARLRPCVEGRRLLRTVGPRCAPIGERQNKADPRNRWGPAPLRDPGPDCDASGILTRAIGARERHVTNNVVMERCVTVSVARKRSRNYDPQGCFGSGTAKQPSGLETMLV